MKNRLWVSNDGKVAIDLSQVFAIQPCRTEIGGVSVYFLGRVEPIRFGDHRTVQIMAAWRAYTESE